MARRHDPERRQRIIHAAIRVVGEKGLAGLSHRSAAAEADVPLGSTTYHFKSLDELMVAALRQAGEGFAKVVAAHGALDDPGGDLATDLARVLGDWLGGDHPGRPSPAARGDHPSQHLPCVPLVVRRPGQQDL
jgi:DNA-binding transcriptional regulator YbjK